MLKYMGPLIAVQDIAVSRNFYENCLGLTVGWDFGVNVQFVGDFSIHQKDHLLSLFGDEQRFAITPKSNASELTFETNEIEAVQSRLKQAGVEFIHEIREQPWGQRVIRAYDPDGHILEIGEAMDATVVRLREQGLSTESILQKTGMPREFVERALQGQVR